MMANKQKVITYFILNHVIYRPIRINYEVELA